MIGNKNGITTHLKKLNPFLTFEHCVALTTKLVHSKAAKDFTCKVIVAGVDKVWNIIAIYFKRSCQQNVSLQSF